MRFVSLVLLLCAVAGVQGQGGRARCGAVGVPKDREECVSATVDSAYTQLSRATGRVLELLPDSARRPFLDASSRWEESVRAACRRRAAGPLDITPARPAYADCVAAAARDRAVSLARTHDFQRAAATTHGGCRAYEPDTVTITGTLERRTYPGRPNYESVAKGDEAETGLYLVVAPAICVTRNLDDVNQPTAAASLVQLVLDQPGYDRLRPYLTKKVTVRGTLFHSHTGHHHAELLLNVLK